MSCFCSGRCSPVIPASTIIGHTDSTLTISTATHVCIESSPLPSQVCSPHADLLHGASCPPRGPGWISHPHPPHHVTTWGQDPAPPPPRPGRFPPVAPPCLG